MFHVSATKTFASLNLSPDTHSQQSYINYIHSFHPTDPGSDIVVSEPVNIDLSRAEIRVPTSTVTIGRFVQLKKQFSAMVSMDEGIQID
jgi:hypothetical protein